MGKECLARVLAGVIFGSSYVQVLVKKMRLTTEICFSLVNKKACTHVTKYGAKEVLWADRRHTKFQLP